ncbi:hypothetical protein F5883DRAFT_637022 [Diaporthe sp. PMI_573]|nr:hypothetical protein F5883DRAFT_637022 [Diaporthaceae sp. PMI_573]
MEHPRTSSTEPLTDLLSLPSELLLHIFTFVGVENFRQDVRRLAPLLLAVAQKLTKHIDLTLHTLPSTMPVHRSPLSPHPQKVGHHRELVSTLKDFSALRTMAIYPSGCRLPLLGQVFKSFASLSQLTSLEINLGTVFLGERLPDVCGPISQLIPNLKRLRCRLPRLCNDLLDTSPGELEELIIGINASEEGPRPNHCSQASAYYGTPRSSLETRLLQFAASMRHPKTVRLIHNIRNSSKTYAFDAIKNRRLLLASTAWDADGVMLPEGWEEDEAGDDDEESADDTVICHDDDYEEDYYRLRSRYDDEAGYEDEESDDNEESDGRE